MDAPHSISVTNYYCLEGARGNLFASEAYKLLTDINSSEKKSVYINTNTCYKKVLLSLPSIEIKGI